MEMLKKEHFEPQVNQRFTIAWQDGQLEAMLAEVSGKGRPLSEELREPFSLIFEAPRESGLLNQGCYTVANDAMGGNTIFLVPVGENGDKYQYQAVFN